MSSSGNWSTKLLYTVGAGVGVSAISGLSYWFYRYWKKDVMPEEWRRVGTLEQLHLFPVKSCAPLKLRENEEVNCELLGLSVDGIKDRALMILDHKNLMVTARGYPKMLLIETKRLGPTTLELSSSAMLETIVIDFATMGKETPGKDIQTTVWGANVDAMLCGKKFDKWLSLCILGVEHGMKLVHYAYPMPTRKPVGYIAKEPYMTNEDTGTFNDATSYMLINLASVDDLNTRLDEPVDALQFRGNFQIKMDTPQPYAEDNWSWIKIGDDAVFRSVVPCTRCILTNINPETGERNPEGNPLKTLKSYRKWPQYQSPVFGVHLGLRRPGNIKVNDTVYIGA